MPSQFRRISLWSSLLVAAPAIAQLPFGPESQANAYTTYGQWAPAVAVAPDGTFVVVWASEGSSGTDTSQASVQARRFGNAGGPLGAQFQVNQWTPGAQVPTGVLMDEDGEFTVIWADITNSPCCYGSEAVGRRFSATGVALGAEFVVAPYEEYAGGVSAAGGPGGEFVAARTNYGIVTVWRYGASGNGLGEFTILPEAGHQLSSEAVVVAPGGEFVVAWLDAIVESYQPVSRDIRAQRYDDAAMPVGGEIQIASVGSGWPDKIGLARNGAGDFLVVWRDGLSVGNDTSETSIQARAFDAQGVALGPQLQVNDLTSGFQVSPSVAAAPDGSFVVAWRDGDAYGYYGGGDGSASGIRARHLSPNGVPRGSSFAVNSLTTGVQASPEVAVLPAGNFLVAWSSETSSGSDTSYESIQLRRFRAALFADGFESGGLSRWVQGGD